MDSYNSYIEGCIAGWLVLKWRELLKGGVLNCRNPLYSFHNQHTMAIKKIFIFFTNIIRKNNAPC